LEPGFHFGRPGSVVDYGDSYVAAGTLSRNTTGTHCFCWILIDGQEGVAEGCGAFGEVLKGTLGAAGVFSRHAAIDVDHAFGQRVVEEPRQLVCSGFDCDPVTEVRRLAPEEGAERRFGRLHAHRRLAERLARAIGPLFVAALEPLAAGDARVWTQVEPRAEVFDRKRAIHPTFRGGSGGGLMPNHERSI
jgi:hypothetical protein